MAETDWREILSFSQRELTQSDKEKLCESLSWMEADDIELNFTDLKTLFRLAQDIMKFKSEQVKNFLGKQEASQRKSKKSKESPAKSPDDSIETIAHQEELIKANKDILDQLYADIAELQGRKTKIQEDRDNVDKESDTSRDALSEINAVMQLEQEITMKNKHIRKLLGDVKTLEETKSKLKEKVSSLKDKLNEATQLIESLTEQLLKLNSENIQLKDALGKSQQIKAKLSMDIETLKTELTEMESKRENSFEEVKAKVQHWKNVARSKKAEIEALYNENTKLKEEVIQASQPVQPSPLKIKASEAEKLKIIEIQEKLSEAANEIIKSANIIDALQTENEQLKNMAEVVSDTISDAKNESDDGKERALINKLKKKVSSLTADLQGAEEMVLIREKELTEIASQLQLLKTDDGINTLLESLKNKKRQLKSKDNGIKSLVQEINSLNERLNDLQLENETMRQKLNIPPKEKISPTGILKKHKEMEQYIIEKDKEMRKADNEIIRLQLENRNLNKKMLKVQKLLKELGCDEDRFKEIYQDTDSDDNEVMPTDGGGESSTVLHKADHSRRRDSDDKREAEMKQIIEENEGLRKGLQEILEFLKDNSKTSSGILALQCPSLDAILNSMEARHAAGWFAPHMAAVMELRSALGGKDALLTALHEARKETYEVISQLAKESQKSTELEKKLLEIDTLKEQYNNADIDAYKIFNEEFGTWMSEKGQSGVDFYDKSQINNLLAKGNYIYEDQLKNGLAYFHNKFKTIFEKMTSIMIQTSDDQNKWSIKEEEYMAQIENLQEQLNENEDKSDGSTGIISSAMLSSIQRKCSYLEESYKYIRTLNENIKNEHLECKKNAMLAASEYEDKIQKLILVVADLTDKLRSSVPVDLFWQQNEALNEITTKYRKNSIEIIIKNDYTDLIKRLENDKLEIMSIIQRQMFDNEPTAKHDTKLNSILANTERDIYHKQLEQVCSELEDKNKLVQHIEGINFKLQESQSKLIDKTLSSTTKEDVDLIKEQADNLAQENKTLKEQCRHIESQLEIALLQLQDIQQRQMSSDIEINMLRHQILDLQSSGDNKAIIARLSGEVLVAHIQASESHKKINRLISALNKEKQNRAETEEIMLARQKIFDVYARRYEAKFRYMHEVMQILRQQYQGSVPILSIESYLNVVEDFNRKNQEVNEKLDEIEDLRSSLMTKHSVYTQILDISQAKCLEEEDGCQHKLQNIVMQGIHYREIEHYKQKIETLEQSREVLLKRCNSIEKALVLVNQGFKKANLDHVLERKKADLDENLPNIELEDIHSDDEPSSKKSQTITLPKPQILKPPKNNADMTLNLKDEKSINIIGSPIRSSTPQNHPPEVVNVLVQTYFSETQKKTVIVQTDTDMEIIDLKNQISKLILSLDERGRELNEALQNTKRSTKEIIALQEERNHLQTTISSLKVSYEEKDKMNEKLRYAIEELYKQIDEEKNIHISERMKTRDEANEENKSLLIALNQIEKDKNDIVAEYKNLLNKEREEYAKSISELNHKLLESQTHTDSRTGSDINAANNVKEALGKYTLKISELEDKCFKLQSDLDGCKTELTTYQSEVDRWKILASERLIKMEQMNSQLEERHCHEVESYKAENKHWLSQLSDTQREHLELRSKLTEQKALYLKQLTDKDAHIEQLRSVIHGLKSQIMNMQTLMSASDPSFDLTAIVEVDEVSDGSDRLELKFDSLVDLQDIQDDSRIQNTVWQEPVIERLRREKQMTNKQNAILRRQIKALAARERRARLDAQNLKNQVFRISTSSSKGVTAEALALHNKIASLQAQLSSARRESQSTVALWDKWKRAQQAAERWQARYEDKCQEVKKVQTNLDLAKSALARLEKEKRVLLSRLSDAKNERVVIVEKQDGEVSEKAGSSAREDYASYSDVQPPVSVRALLDRVQAQQRRIAALEVADKGNEVLVSEYEKSLAEITSLKGQVLKLESTLLEVQIRSPLKPTQDSQPELEYWKNYCEMLKEENVQLNLKVNSLETTPTTADQHRVNDLERTVLTLRGLVSKLQAEQKSASNKKPSESRPGSGYSFTTEKSDKGRSQLESYRIEITNLKRSIQDKDLLLERSKEMLRIASEREDYLLSENASLRRQLDQMTRSIGA